MDVSTRWNSSLDMIVRFLELRSDLYATLSELKMNDLLHYLEVSKIDILEKIVPLLQPFKDTTNMMSSETTCSVSLLRPLLCNLLNVTRPDPSLNDPPKIHQMKAAMYHSLERRYCEDSEFLDECTFMDPRVKSTPYLTSIQRAALLDRVARKMCDIQNDNLNPEDANIVSNSCSETNVPPKACLESLLGSMFEETSASPHKETTQRVEENVNWELRQYTSYSGCKMSECPLKW
jgi:hypothetical protein